MKIKLQTLLTHSAVALMITGTIFSAEETDNKATQMQQTRLSKAPHKESPEYDVFVGNLRFNLLLAENPEPKIRKKLLAVLSNSSEESIENALKPILVMLENDRTFIAEYGPQRGAGQILGELNKVYDNFLSQYYCLTPDLSTERESSRYFQKAIVGYAFTLPKLKEQVSNEIRLKRLADIVVSKNFTERRKAFAQFAIIEQKVKHSFVEPTTPPFPYKAEDARLEYSKLLEETSMSMRTRLSIQYHLVELDYLGIGIVERNLASIKTAFQQIYDHPDAHAFTKGLAMRYLNEIAKNESKGLEK